MTDHGYSRAVTLASGEPVDVECDGAGVIYGTDDQGMSPDGVYEVTCGLCEHSGVYKALWAEVIVPGDRVLWKGQQRWVADVRIDRWHGEGHQGLGISIALDNPEDEDHVSDTASIAGDAFVHPSDLALVVDGMDHRPERLRRETT